MEKVDNMQEQKSNVNRQMETLRKKQKERIEVKSTIKEMNAFDGLINRLDVAEERISELEEMSVAEIQREKTLKKLGYPRTVEQLQKV